MSDAAPAETPVEQKAAPVAIPNSDLVSQLHALTHRPGWKTTEFYLVLLVVIVLNTLAEKGIGSPTASAIISALLAFAYQFLRLIEKNDQTTVLYNAIVPESKR